MGMTSPGELRYRKELDNLDLSNVSVLRGLMVSFDKPAHRSAGGLSIQHIGLQYESLLSPSEAPIGVTLDHTLDSRVKEILSDPEKELKWAIEIDTTKSKERQVGAMTRFMSGARDLVRELESPACYRTVGHVVRAIHRLGAGEVPIAQSRLICFLRSNEEGEPDLSGGPGLTKADVKMSEPSGAGEGIWALVAPMVASAPDADGRQVILAQRPPGEKGQLYATWHPLIGPTSEIWERLERLTIHAVVSTLRDARPDVLFTSEESEEQSDARDGFPL